MNGYKLLTYSEHEYLRRAIEPIRDCVLHVIKYCTYDKDIECVAIEYNFYGNYYSITTPVFKSGTKFVKLKRNKYYSLNELEL